MDSDGDGLPDSEELDIHGTNPLVADTDGDGLNDGDEVDTGTNPLQKEPTTSEVGCRLFHILVLFLFFKLVLSRN